MSPPSPYTGPKPVPPVLDTTPAPPFGAHIYQPPSQPSAAAAASSRKRSRPGPAANKEPRHTPTANGWSNISKAEALLRSEAASPVPFVTTRYRLAGGLDTPGLAAAASDVDFDLRTEPYANFRRTWTVDEGEDAPLRPTIATTGCKRKSPPNMKPPAQWPQCVWSFVGDVAGKVWEFARSNAFKGFYAGGGKGYEIPAAGPQAHAGVDEQTRGYTTGFSPYESFDYNATPIPGQFPVDDMWGSVVESPSERPVKRQHVESGSGWVLVERRPQGQSPSPRIATRRLPAGTTAPRVTTARPAYRRSVQGPGSSSLRSPTSLSLPRSPMHTRHDSATSSSPRRSPAFMPAEVQEYETRRRKEERQADASIRKINAQLKAMIREGREALGSKVEIVDDADTQMVDEGYSEGLPGWK